MSDDRVIDLSAYLRAKEEEEDRRPLSLAGTEGERRRYVLPLWRMAYLAEARWAGLVKLDDSGRASKASVVLDQGADPARWAPADGLPVLPAELPPPALEIVGRGSLAMPLGRAYDGSEWWVVLCERKRAAMPDTEVREDLVFLAGECAGLLSLLERPE